MLYFLFALFFLFCLLHALVPAKRTSVKRQGAAGTKGKEGARTCGDESSTSYGNSRFGLFNIYYWHRNYLRVRANTSMSLGIHKCRFQKSMLLMTSKAR
jgi:hypothetical protein